MPEIADETIAGGRLTVDLDAIAANWRAMNSRTVASGSRAGATVKADAYGCGVTAVAKRLTQEGCGTFFVALPEEGRKVREVAPNAEIYVLNGLFPGAAPFFAEARLRPVLGSIAEIEEWALFCRARRVALEAAIHVDTGMNRLGLTAEDTAKVASDNTMLDAFKLSLVISHLVNGGAPEDPINGRQLEKFKALSGQFPDAQKSLSNSAGCMMGREFHFNVARPGIALYGGQVMDEGPNELEPVVKVEAKVIQVRTVHKGDTVGYGAARTAKRESRIAVISSGYADGFHRLGSGTDTRPGTHVWFNGHDLPVFGRISMDMQAIDVTDVPAGQLRRGDYVEIIGPHVPALVHARAAETIDYEYLTGLSKRYARHYASLKEPVA